MGNLQVRAERAWLRQAVVAAACAVILAGCRGQERRESVEVLAGEFVYTTLAYAPVSATQAGYHQHQGRNLDEEFGDFSAAGLNKQRVFYADFERRLRLAWSGTDLSADDRADLEILRNQTALAQLELNNVRSYRTNPTLYVELVGNGLYAPYMLQYAPAVDRFRHIIARLRVTPALLKQGRANLVSAPEVWNRVARQENEGNLALIDKTLRAACPPELKLEFDIAARDAMESLRAFSAWLESDLSRRTNEWRLGPQKYGQLFRYSLGTGEDYATVLADAEAQLASVRAEMARIAGSEPVEQALDRIATQHATAEGYLDAARNDLQETTEFVRTTGLLPLPDTNNLKVIETPEFMRGAYGVGGFSPAPPLQPKLGAYFWVTPIPANWPADRAESKLREYNTYGMKILTVHEAMPGHWVQFQYANSVQPEWRKLLRAIYGNVPYIEGWAVYATKAMIDAGYYNDDPGMHLTWGKQLLRVIANTILDIRLHTTNFSEAEALELMIRQTYQEREEAVAKYQRAQLSAAQLPAYFMGWRAWSKLRDDARKAKGTAWDAAEFHRRTLQTGAVPMTALRQMVLPQ